MGVTYLADYWTVTNHVDKIYVGPVIIYLIKWSHRSYKNYTDLCSNQWEYISDTYVNTEIRHWCTHCPDKTFAISAAETFC